MLPVRRRAARVQEVGTLRYLEQYDVSATGIARAVLAEETRDRFVPCAPEEEQSFDSGCAARFVEHQRRVGARMGSRRRRPRAPVAAVPLPDARVAMVGAAQAGLGVVRMLCRFASSERKYPAALFSTPISSARSASWPEQSASLPGSAGPAVTFLRATFFAA